MVGRETLREFAEGSDRLHQAMPTWQSCAGGGPVAVNFVGRREVLGPA